MDSSDRFVVPFLFLLIAAGSTARPLYPLPSQTANGLKRLLQNSRPCNIVHRGSNSEIPEETVTAYEKAIEEGDFILTDILSSKDGFLICFHDVTMNVTADIAHRKEFVHRQRMYKVQGVNTTGFLTIDFTLKEFKTLRVKRRYPFHDQQYNGETALSISNFGSSALN